MALTENWAWQEMHGARLDTPRRLPNLVRICEKLLQHAGKSLSAALGDATRQAAFDLFSRTQRTVADLIAGHVAQTSTRCQTAPGPILVIQDSVRLDYFALRRCCKGLGPIGSSPRSYGLWGHSALAVDAAGLPLGVLALQFWVRDAEEHGRRKRRKRLPVSEKESRIWGETMAAVEQALPADVPVVLVQDREADLYPFLVQARRRGTQFVVRAYHRRNVRVLAEGDEDPAEADPAEADPAEGAAVRAAESEWGSLLDAWEDAPVRVSERRVYVKGRPATAARPAQPDREAVVEVRSAPVEILRPQRGQDRKAGSPSTQLWALWVRELAPPEGEEGVSWLLLSTLPAGTPEQAAAVIELYERRWLIERFHRVLKSGLRVERFQIDDGLSLMNVLAVCWVVAWQILRLTEAARVQPDAPAAQWLAPEEIGVLAAHFGQAPTTLAEGLRQVAEFGGWPGATRKAVPGTDVLWRGFRDLATAVKGWRAARRTTASPHDTS